MYIHSASGLYQHCVTCYTMKCWKKDYNAKVSTIDQLYETANMIEEASYYNHGMQCTKSTHTAVSNTKPTAYKTQPLMGQSRTIVGGENVVHRMQTTCAYNAPNPEQKTVQVRDSLTKLSYRKKPLPWPPKREGNSMNVTCYEYGQVGHIWTNCPHRASSAAWIMWSSPLLWCFAVSFSNHS